MLKNKKAGKQVKSSETRKGYTCKYTSRHPIPKLVMVIEELKLDVQ